MYDLFDFLPRSSLLGSFVTFFGVLSIVYFKQKGKGQQKMSCNIVINQKPSLPASDRSAPEAKAKDQKRVKAARRGRENYMKKPKEMLLKDNQKTQMTLKEFIDYFQQDLNDTASTPMAIEETMRIAYYERKTQYCNKYIHWRDRPCGKCLSKICMLQVPRQGHQPSL